MVVRRNTVNSSSKSIYLRGRFHGLVSLLLLPVLVCAQEKMECQGDFCDEGILNQYEELEFDESGTVWADSPAQMPNQSWLSFLYSDKQVVTLRHELSYMESMGEEGIETNRSSVRLEWDKPLNDHFYVKFDGKANVYWWEDRRIEGEAKNHDVALPLREFYIQGSIGDFSASIGRQIIIWGESEIAAVTDVISPRNISDFYFTSLDESRIGQDIVKADYYSRLGRFSLVYVINPKSNEDPFIPGEYNIDGYKVGDHQIEDQERDLSSGYGFSWKKPIANGDYSLMLAELPTNQTYYLAMPGQGDPDRRMIVYPRYQFLGGAMNLSFGDLSVNLESAYKKNMPFQSAVSATGLEDRNVVETAFAIAYSINATSSFYIGASNQQIGGDVSTLENEYKSTNDIGAGISGSFYYELIGLSYDFQRQLEDKNSIHVLSSSFAATDNLFLSLDFFKLTAEDDEVFAFYEQRSVLFRVEYQF